jgi:hypothetical protein
MSDQRKERRKSRRVDTALGGTLAGPGAAPIEVQTMNLSAGGVYATTNRYFTPFTKVQLAVALPHFGEEDAGAASDADVGTVSPALKLPHKPSAGEKGAKKAAKPTGRGPAGPSSTSGSDSAPDADAGRGAPSAAGAGEGSGDADAPIQLEGIVVRCDPQEDAPETYSVAIAFLHLPPDLRHRIEAYVTWRLERSLLESAGSVGNG